jgi:hypothetical protein
MHVSACCLVVLLSKPASGDYHSPLRPAWWIGEVSSRPQVTLHVQAPQLDCWLGCLCSRCMRVPAEVHQRRHWEFIGSKAVLCREADGVAASYRVPRLDADHSGHGMMSLKALPLLLVLMARQEEGGASQHLFLTWCSRSGSSWPAPLISPHRCGDAYRSSSTLLRCSVAMAVHPARKLQQTCIDNPAMPCPGRTGGATVRVLPAVLCVRACGHLSHQPLKPDWSHAARADH